MTDGPRIDFYVLKDGGPQGRLRTFAKLCHKLYVGRHQGYVHCDDRIAMETLDGFLWTFHDIGFIPHSTLGSKTATKAPIVLGHSATPPPKETGEEGSSTDYLLINMAEAVPEFFSDFTRIIEIIPSQEPQRQQGRARYQYYKNQELIVNTHTL